MTRRTTALLAMDRDTLDGGVALGRAGLAFDRESARSTTENGHMLVTGTPISKATINPYYGREIPGAEELGLDPNKIYRLYRDPAELEKAAPTFDKLPLLLQHKPISADDHDHEVVVGTIGEGTRFENPFLTSNLNIWTREGIKAVESGKQKELSASYRYRADMTPGEVNGEKYDGVMRDIRGNHVALVEKGRAGRDVIVADSAIQLTTKEKFLMKTAPLSRIGLLTLGALMASTAPVLAQDAQISFAPLLKGLTGKNFAAKKASIVKGVEKLLTSSKLAQDADAPAVVAAVEDLLEAIGEPEMAAVVEEHAGENDPDNNVTGDASIPEAARDFLAGKLSDEDMAQLMSLMGGAAAQDETPEAKAEREKKQKADKDKAANDGKKAMDSAIETAVSSAVTAATAKVKQDAKDLRDAEIAVRPYVGELVAMDSAEAVYRGALDVLGIDHEEVKELPALKAILKTQPLPNARKETVLAADEASVKGFAERFPEAARISAL